MSVAYNRQIRLPLLRELVDRLIERKVVADLASVIVVGYQHYLGTLVDLVLAIIRLGVPASDIFCCGKNYSCDEAVHRDLLALGVRSFGCNQVDVPGTFGPSMAKLANKTLEAASLQCRMKHCKKVVVISDGFCAIEEAVKQDWGGACLTGVLQTSSARYVVDRIKTHPVPLVDIAYSAAKTRLETTFIIESALEAMCRTINRFNLIKNLGIVGLGNIGRHLLSSLRQLYPQLQIVCSDKDEKIKAKISCVPLEQVLQHSELIIGCSGSSAFEGQSDLARDVLQGKFGDRTFASFSSGDYEFLTLLRLGVEMGGWQKMGEDCHSDLVFTTTDGEHQIRVLNGGYPANFDGSATSDRSEVFQITRALLLAAFAEAANRSDLEVRGASTPEEMIRVLDAKLQQEVAISFLQMIDKDCRLFSKETHNNFLDTDWIAQHSKYNFVRRRD